MKPHKTHTLKKISMKIIELTRTMRFTKSINDVMEIVQNVIQCDNNVYHIRPGESTGITQKVRDLFLAGKLKPTSRGFPREYKDAFHVSTAMKREQLSSEESKASQAQSMLQSSKRSHKAESTLEDVEDTTEKKLSVRIRPNVDTLAKLTSGVKLSSTEKLVTIFKFNGVIPEHNVLGSIPVLYRVGQHFQDDFCSSVVAFKNFISEHVFPESFPKSMLVCNSTRTVDFIYSALSMTCKDRVMAYVSSLLQEIPSKEKKQEFFQHWKTDKSVLIADF